MPLTSPFSPEISNNQTHFFLLDHSVQVPSSENLWKSWNSRVEFNATQEVEASEAEG